MAASSSSHDERTTLTGMEQGAVGYERDNWPLFRAKVDSYDDAGSWGRATVISSMLLEYR
jgi:hypothetical protein